MQGVVINDVANRSNLATVQFDMLTTNETGEAFKTCVGVRMISIKKQLKSKLVIKHRVSPA